MNKNDEILEWLQQWAWMNLGVYRHKVTREADYYEDLGGDSLNLVILVVEIENHFDIEVNPESLPTSTSIGCFVDFIVALTEPKIERV